MDLYFLRHGLAGERSEWQGDDDLRPLTEEGKAELRREAAVFAALGLLPDLILTSPLVRCSQTADIVARGMGISDRVITDDRLAPGFGRKKLRLLLTEYAGRKSLMLVGHEPDFSKTVGKLIGGGRVAVAKGGLAVVSVPDIVALKGKLTELVPPEMLLGPHEGREGVEPGQQTGDGPEMGWKHVSS